MPDPHNSKSQTGYLFTCGGTIISWKLVKQTITTTSSNHAELLALHEASREGAWLRPLIQHEQKSYGLSSRRIKTTIIYEDSTTCIVELKESYIKGDQTKHISPKFVFTHDLYKNGDISIQQIRSCGNLADLFTKSLPNRVFEQLIQKIDLRRLRDGCIVEGEK